MIYSSHWDQLWLHCQNIFWDLPSSTELFYVFIFCNLWSYKCSKCWYMPITLSLLHIFSCLWSKRPFSMVLLSKTCILNNGFSFCYTMLLFLSSLVYWSKCILSLCTSKCPFYQTLVRDLLYWNVSFIVK